MKYKGEIKDFPEEVVEWMLDQQEKQGNERDVSVFERSKTLGFNWASTGDGFHFCNTVIIDKKFDKFFERYPKFKRGDRVLVGFDFKWHERIYLTTITGAEYPHVCVHPAYEEKFRRGEKFSTVRWKKIKPIEDKLEITVTLNGEKVSPSELSKETWDNFKTNHINDTLPYIFLRGALPYGRGRG